jgi:molybdopterin-guanine dinucleotide biosynthesis protein A
MGRDKALIGDPPWAHRVAAALAGAGCEPVVLLGGDPRLADPSAAGAYAWEPDPSAATGEGPLVAVATAAGRWPGRSLVVAACDLPSLQPAAVAEVLAPVERGDAAAAVPVVGGRDQWSLVALAPGGASLAVDAAQRGTRALHRALGGHAMRVRPATGAAGLVDLDHPGDLPGDFPDDLPDDHPDRT